MPPISVFLSNQTASAQQLFREAVTQVSHNLSRCVKEPATCRVLSEYFLRIQPEITIAGTPTPFGVTLAHATILYHLKLHRPSTADLENILALLSTIATLASDAELNAGPFFEEVVRGALMGLPPRARHIRRRSAPLLTAQPHFVVLLPAALFDSFAFIACNLACNLRLGGLREEWLAALGPLASAPSVLVSLRARLLQMRCSPMTARQHAAEIVSAVANNSEALPTEAVALIFDHLRLAVNVSEPDRTTEEHALCIAASVQLLELQSPVRRKYVECYLYPALRDPRMEQMLSSKIDTSAQIGKQLLRLMSTTSSASSSGCPFYLCACALFQRMLRAESPLRGAMFLVSLCQLVMPEGGVFVSSLAVDAQMDSEYFAQVIFEIVGALTEAIDFATRDEDDDDRDRSHQSAADSQLSPVAKLIDRGGTSLFVKVLFMLRLIVSAVVSTSSAAFGGGDHLDAGSTNSGRSSVSNSGSHVLSLRGGSRRSVNNNIQQQQQNQQRPDAIVMDLRAALSRETIHKIGSFVENVVLPSVAAQRQQNNNQAGGVADLSARVLVVEIAMLLHHEFVDETIGRVRDFLTEQLASKTSDAATNPAIVSHMNRVMLALADSPTARDRFATVHCASNWLRHDPLDPVTHVMLLNVMARCPTPATRLELFDSLHASIVSYVLPAVRRHLVNNNNNGNDGMTMDIHGAEDVAGASSALVLVTRMMLMVRPTGVSATAGAAASSASSNKTQQQQQLAKRLCVDIAMIASSLAASNQLKLKNHVALVLWWASLSLLRFGGEKTSVAVSSAGGNDASSACYHLFTALRYVHLSFPKLVGIATSRLVQDFCLHAPIIIDNLVSVLDENASTRQQQPRQHHNSRRRASDNNGEESLLDKYSLALRDDSPFRTWLRKHIVRSVPSRTALLIAYAQCIASRVRVHGAPHELVVPNSNSNFSSLVSQRAFSAMLTETVLATDRQVCEVFCKSACAWLRGDACPKMTTPGPFLMVICALISLHDVAPSASRSRTRIAEVLQQQVPRVATVAETLKYDSPVFARFAQSIVSVCTGQEDLNNNNNDDDGHHDGGQHMMMTNNNSLIDPYRQQQQNEQLHLMTAAHNQRSSNGDNNDDDDDHFDGDDGEQQFYDDGDDGQLDDNDDANFNSRQQKQPSSFPASALVDVAPQQHQNKRIAPPATASVSSSHGTTKENKSNNSIKGTNNRQRKNDTNEEDARDFHVDTWQALQRQSCQSLLLEVRNIMQDDFGMRVGGPTAASEDVAQQQHKQLMMLQRMMMTADDGGSELDGSQSITPGTTTNGAASWQEQQSYRTALREVRGMLVNTGSSGGGAAGRRAGGGGGFQVDLI